MSRCRVMSGAVGTSIGAIIATAGASIGAMLVLAGAALAVGHAATVTSPSGPGPSPGNVRYVDVSVATVWASPSAPRGLDRPALLNPVNVLGWARVLSTSARLGLVGRIETQALLGEPVRVLEQHGAWTKIAVIDQPTPKNPSGYPGWVPTRQLTSSSNFGQLLEGSIAVVSRPTALVQDRVPRLALSYGTQLPLFGRSGVDVVVATPGGSMASLPVSAVHVYSSPAAIPAPSGNELVATARLFLGVRYLWGGTSAFGFDCSGLVNLIYRANGIVIPRDADAQALTGRQVSRRALTLGDLVFFATDPPSRAISHVAMYIGDGEMIEAPDSAGAVHIIPLATLASRYVTARRYL